MFEGFCVDLIDELSIMLDFDYAIYQVPDEEYGNITENEEWTGMMADLINNTADIALGALSVLPEREIFVDFTIPYYDLVGISIMMKKIKEANSLFQFLTVMEDEVWGCIVGAYFLTSLAIWIICKWSPSSSVNRSEADGEDDGKRRFGLKESFWFCLTALTPQGGGETPRNISGWFLTTGWWFFAFICITTYTANLGAFLTVARINSKVQNLDDLNHQKRIK